MVIVLYKPSAKVAQLIIDFFEQHPDRNHCIVGLKEGGQAAYQREDIPTLKKIIDERS